jgi:hypothetical protein
MARFSSDGVKQGAWTGRTLISGRRVNSDYQEHRDQLQRNNRRQIPEIPNAIPIIPVDDST